MIKMVGFDLDGTLVNSLKSIALGVNLALKNMGYKEYPTKKYEQFIGNGIKGVVDKIFLIEKYDESKKEELLNNIKEYLQKHATYELEIYKDIDKLLKYLNENNIYAVILTNKEENIAKDVAKNFLSEFKFEKVYGSNIIPLKPNSDIVDKLCKEYKIEKSEFLFVGDMQVDEDFAKKSNVDFVYCNWGFGGAKNVSYSVDSPTQIIELIKNGN